MKKILAILIFFAISLYLIFSDVRADLVYFGNKSLEINQLDGRGFGEEINSQTKEIISDVKQEKIINKQQSENASGNANNLQEDSKEYVISYPIKAENAVLHKKPKYNDGERVSENNPAYAPVKYLVYKKPDYSYVFSRLVRGNKDSFIKRIGEEAKFVNESIIKERNFVYEMQEHHHRKKKITGVNKEKLKAVAKKYKVSWKLYGSNKFYDKLLNRVNIIPISMAVAQGAVESGWGKSRFAKEANNYFGHWCFTKGCGLVPSARSEGESA